MKTDEMIDRLGQAVGDFQAASTRISELEKQLERETDKSERIKGLESANSALQDQIMSLQNAVKIKKEQIDLDLNETARVGKLESANATLRANLVSLQNNIEDSNAASATIGRNDVENESLRQEVKSLQRTVEIKERFQVDLQEALASERDSLADMTKKYAEAIQRAEFLNHRCNELKAEVQTNRDTVSQAQEHAADTLRQLQCALEGEKTHVDRIKQVVVNLDKAKAQIVNLKDINMDLRKEYDTVRAENHRLQEACGNIAQLVNHLRKDDTANNTGTSHDQGHENVDRRPGTITIDLTNDDEEEVVVQESRPCESQTRPTGVSVDDAGSSTGARTPKPSSDKMKIYKNHMNALPLLPDHPGIAQLKPICEYSSTLTLEDITKMVDSSIPSHPVLYVQRHTILMKKGHFIACGLTHRYDSNTEKWTAESDLQGLHAKRRELFVARGDNLFYAGLYECVDLDMLYPGNRMCLPPRIGFAEFAESAFSPEITKKTGKLRSYLAGKPLEVVSLGLRCVGFNRELYDTLRGGSGGKRAAESEGGGPRKKQKRSKGTGTA